MKSLCLVLAALLAVFLASCENQESAAIRAHIKFMAALNEDHGSLTTKSTDSGILVDSATISLQNIRLLVKNMNGQISVSGSTVFPGPYLIDLVARKSTPVVESSSIVPGTYYGINGILNVPQNRGYSIFVSGTYTMNDKWWNFYYKNSGSLTFQVVDSAGFTVDQANPEIWVMIDVVSFFRGIDLSKAIADSGNIIRLSESSNQSLAVAIQNNFTLAASVSNTPPSKGKDNNSTSGQSSGGSSGGSGNSTTQGSTNSSGNPGTVNNSGGSQGQDKDKNKEKDNKDKQKEKEKNKNKSKHNHKDNDKTKDKSKDKDKNKEGD